MADEQSTVLIPKGWYRTRISFQVDQAISCPFVLFKITTITKAKSLDAQSAKHRALGTGYRRYYGSCSETSATNSGR
jgi:hypothetical protein